jgi:hypothetical protein
MAKDVSSWMRRSIGLRWNRRRRWPQEIRSTTMCSDLSVRGSPHQKRGGLRKILRMAMTVSKRRSINGSRQRDIEKISCSPRPLVSASPAQQAPPLIAPIGQWRSPATMNRREWLQARRRRRRRPKGKHLFRPAGSNSSVSAFDRTGTRRIIRNSTVEPLRAKLNSHRISTVALALTRAFLACGIQNPLQDVLPFC